MITIFRNELIQSLLRYLASTRDIYEPIIYHMGVPAGIVKHCPVLNQGNRVKSSVTKD